MMLPGISPSEWHRYAAALSERGYSVYYDGQGRLVIRLTAPPHYEFVWLPT